ncbi:MAG TPA: FmdB family zinc ribbon protein [Iamia sp.]
MARYEYRCPTCTERFEVERSITAPAGSVACPAGHGEARRVFSPVAAVGRAGAGPAAMPAGGGCCGGACGCG